eukprot:6204612-Pleurochrysis_carterae.AAC.3
MPRAEGSPVHPRVHSSRLSPLCPGGLLPRFPPSLAHPSTGKRCVPTRMLACGCLLLTARLLLRPMSWLIPETSCSPSSPDS